MTRLVVPIQRLDPNIPLPAYAYEGDAALDISSRISTTLEPGKRACIPTGLALGLPKGYAAFVLPRSGLARNHGITIVNSPGLIDSNYRGEIAVVLHNTDNEQAFIINRGDRIAQLLIAPIPEIILEDVETLDVTSRNDSGFGSSGVVSL